MRNGVIGSTADSDSVSRGSSPFSVVPWQGRRVFTGIRLLNGVWLSLVERYVRDVEVAGSNPVTPIFKKIPQSFVFTGFEVFLYFQSVSENYSKSFLFYPLLKMLLKIIWQYIFLLCSGQTLMQTGCSGQRYLT